MGFGVIFRVTASIEESVKPRKCKQVVRKVRETYASLPTNCRLSDAHIVLKSLIR